METSIFLAKVIGLVSVLSTMAVLIRYKKSLALEEEAVKSPGVTYLTGFATLILGVLLVVSHSVWTYDWRLVITIVGWLVLLKGIGRIFFPNTVRLLIEKKRDNRRFLLGEVVVFLTGLYLLYYGFIVY
jgi:hypothetical protein